ncbi:MAG: hypothetical protein Q9M43_09925 [Sulfurimonas sp.]|nr:hypothetical protein [Sulfurimonas sp.]
MMKHSMLTAERKVYLNINSKSGKKDFLKAHKPEDSTAKVALEEERSKSKSLAKELRRKEKALAETATLLVLQKKFQALLEDEGE